MLTYTESGQTPGYPGLKNDQHCNIDSGNRLPAPQREQPHQGKSEHRSIASGLVSQYRRNAISSDIRSVHGGAEAAFST